jgi:hypothetical protein
MTKPTAAPLGATTADAIVGTPIGVTLGISLIGAVAGGVLGAVLPTNDRYKAATAGAMLGTAVGGAYESVTRWPSLDQTYGGSYTTARWAILAGTIAAAAGGLAVAFLGKKQ